MDGAITRRAPQSLAARVTEVSRVARDAGLEVPFLGYRPVLAEHLLVVGSHRAMTIGPAALELGDGARMPAPRDQIQKLKQILRLVGDFPQTAIVHEVPRQDALALVTPERDGSPALVPAPAMPILADSAVVARPITSAQRRLLIPVPPPPPAARRHAEQLGGATLVVGRTLRLAVPLLAGILALPVAAAVSAGVVIGMGAGLDPMILGVVPEGRGEPGELAAYFLLARWEW